MILQEIPVSEGGLYKGPPWDIVLSSGFLAFARHAGVLRAVEEAELPVGGVCGTSSGALVGALWSAGIPAERITKLVAERARPLSLMKLQPFVWRGIFSMRRLMEFLEELLPEDFEDLRRPFAVGVAEPGGRFQLLNQGPLVPAVAASCAMPFIFHPVNIGGRRFKDGGAVDRLGLEHWRALRGERRTLVHLVERTWGAESKTELPDADGVAPWETELCVVRTPASGASFRNLGDVMGQVEEARRIAGEILAAHSG